MGLSFYYSKIPNHFTWSDIPWYYSNSHSFGLWTWGSLKDFEKIYGNPKKLPKYQNNSCNNEKWDCHSIYHTRPESTPHKVVHLKKPVKQPKFDLWNWKTTDVFESLEFEKTLTLLCSDVRRSRESLI